jgi:hypothetical protein
MIRKKEGKEKKGLGKAVAWPTEKRAQAQEKLEGMESRTFIGPEGQVWVWLIP